MSAGNSGIAGVELAVGESSSTAPTLISLRGSPVGELGAPSAASVPHATVPVTGGVPIFSPVGDVGLLCSYIRWFLPVLCTIR